MSEHKSDEFRLVRQVDVSGYTQAMKKLDEDYLTQLVLEVSSRTVRVVFPDQVLHLVCADPNPMWKYMDVDQPFYILLQVYEDMSSLNDLD